MAILRNIARRIFGKSFEVMDLRIAFHKEANLYGTHGHLIASHIDQKLKGAQVRFVFVGLSTPPALTPKIFEYIWEEAKAQGYTPESLFSYGTTLETNYRVTPGELVSEERRLAENAMYGRTKDTMPEATRALADLDMRNSLRTQDLSPQQTAGVPIASAWRIPVDARSNTPPTEAVKQ